jgi:hypothetical protein
MMGLGGRVTTPTPIVKGSFGLIAGFAATTGQFTKVSTTSGTFGGDPASTILPDEQHRTSPSQTLYNPAIALDATASVAASSSFRFFAGVLILAAFSDRPTLLAGENSALGLYAASGGRTPSGMPNINASHNTSVYIGPTFGFQVGE